MANVKISALPAGTTLVGTEEIPGVQSAATVKTTPNAIVTLVKSTADAFTLSQSAPSYKATGVTGATAGADPVLAGSNVSGAPTAGTNTAGYFTFDDAGDIYYCTVGGTPGTWRQVSGSGRELGYAEITSSPTAITAVGSGSAVDITGLSVTVTVATRPIFIEAYFATSSNNTASSGGGIAIQESTTILQQCDMLGDAAGERSHLHSAVRLAPSAGSHTYKITGYALVGGTFSPLAGAQRPAFIRVVEG